MLSPRVESQVRQTYLASSGRMFALNLKRAVILSGLCVLMSGAWGGVLAQSLSADDELRWKFAVGDKYRVSYEQSVAQTTEVLLKPVKVTTTTRLELLWEVKSVDEAGTAVMTQRFTRVAMSLESSRGDKVDFDTQSQERPTGQAAELMKGIGPLLEAPFEVSLTSRGEVVKIGVSEDSLAALRQAPGSMRLRQLFSEENLTETLALVVAVLPENAVAEGASWKLERPSSNQDLPIDVVHTLTYAGHPVVGGEVAASPLARIDVVTEFVPRSGPAERREDESPVPSVESQSSTGTIWFDDVAGHPVRTEQKLNLVTTSPLREMTIRAEAETTTTATIEKL